MNLLDKNNNKDICKESIFKKVYGFSLIEVVVTMAIFAIMMGIAFTNYPRLSQAVAFDTAAQNTLDALKSAQITGSARGGDYRGDGVYFKLSDPFDYILFSDYANIIDSVTSNKKSDKIYSNNLPIPPAISELDQLTSKNKIQNNVKVNRLCVKDSSSVPDCTKTELSISFTRPYVAANVSDNATKDIVITDNYFLFEKAGIELFINGSAGADKKCIIIYKYGYMEIKSGACNL